MIEKYSVIFYKHQVTNETRNFIVLNNENHFDFFLSNPWFTTKEVTNENY